MGLFGPPNVEKLKAKKDIRGLTKVLAYKNDQSVRARAAAALGEIGDPQVVDALITALNDQEFVRQAAIKALGRIGDPRAVDPLITALKSNNTIQIVSATQALGKIGDPKAVGPLIKLLHVKNLNSKIREVIVQALGEIGDERAVEPIIATFKDGNTALWEAAIHSLATIGTPAVELLKKTLMDQDDDVCKVAAGALGEIGWKPDQSETGAVFCIKQNKFDLCVKMGEPAVTPLITTLKSTESDLREAAARALGKIGNDRAVEPLIKVLNDKKNVRETAFKALGEIGSHAIEPLLSKLNDKDATIRKRATQALDEIGWKPDKNEVGAAFWIAKTRWDECTKIGTPAVIPLVDALKDKNPKIREAAAQTLDEIGWKPDKNEVGAAFWIAKAQWDECTKIGTPAVIPLIDALKDENPKIREAAVRPLGEIKDTRAVKPLIAFLNHKNPTTKQAAIEALGMIGDTRAVMPLIDLLKDIMPTTKQAAIEALGMISDARSVKPLIDLLKDQNKSIVMLSIQALGQIGDDRAVKPLIALLRNPEWSIRSATAEVLVSLYQFGKLDEETQRLIFAKKEAIIKPHLDLKTHTDEQRTDHYMGHASDCFHEDSLMHQDKGIGVDFPV